PGREDEVVERGGAAPASAGERVLAGRRFVDVERLADDEEAMVVLRDAARRHWKVVEENHVRVHEAAQVVARRPVGGVEGRVEARVSRSVRARSATCSTRASRAASAAPDSSPSSSTWGSASSAVQLAIARFWISPIRPSNGFGTVKIVSTRCSLTRVQIGTESGQTCP